MEQQVSSHSPPPHFELTHNKYTKSKLPAAYIRTAKTISVPFKWVLSKSRLAQDASNFSHINGPIVFLTMGSFVLRAEGNSETTAS